MDIKSFCEFSKINVAEPKLLFVSALLCSLFSFLSCSGPYGPVLETVNWSILGTGTGTRRWKVIVWSNLLVINLRKRGTNWNFLVDKGWSIFFILKLIGMCLYVCAGQTLVVWADWVRRCGWRWRRRRRSWSWRQRCCAGTGYRPDCVTSATPATSTPSCRSGSTTLSSDRCLAVLKNIHHNQFCWAGSSLGLQVLRWHYNFCLFFFSYTQCCGSGSGTFAWIRIRN